jgi:transcriptional regulator with XRE-family HTH domain
MDDETLIEKRDHQADRFREELRRLVRDSRRTQRDIERDNGFTQGYLSQVLQGNITLTVRHLYGVLLALGETPEGFFGRLAGGLAGIPGFDEIRERMDRYEAAIEQLERDGVLKPSK